MAHPDTMGEEMSVMKLLIVGADGQLGTDMARLLAPLSAVTALTFPPWT